jgi:poly(3-hydroxybutyrate) depolymerase
MASQQWVESSLRHAQLTESEAGRSRAFPAGFALYFQPADTIQVPYLVYVPSSFSSAKLASLLVYLHGGVVNQDYFSYQDPQVSNEPIFALANQYNALVLYPFARKDFGWVDQEKAFQHVLTILDRVKKHYSVPFTRIYLGGMSNGGTAAYWYATKHAELFNGFYAFSSWPQLKLTSTDYSKLSKSIPFLSVNAKDDTVFPYAGVKAIYDQHQARATDWRFKTIAEGGHGFIYGPSGQSQMQAVFDELFGTK